jgi:hypothetical protein
MHDTLIDKLDVKPRRETWTAAVTTFVFALRG